MDLTHQLHQAAHIPCRRGYKKRNHNIYYAPCTKEIGPIQSAGKKALHAVAVMLPVESKGIRRPCD